MKPSSQGIQLNGAVTATGDDERYVRERTAHNKYFSEATRKSADRFYCIVHESRALFEGVMRERARGATTLEYGCGMGRHSHLLAGSGAQRIVGIDISNVAIDEARTVAQRDGLTQAEYFVMNAEALTFDDRTFDLICGTAILHHLDLKRSFSELARTLKPGGSAVFMEPLGHNPAINLYRRLTPQLRTVDEHPLMMRDLRLARQYFAKVHVHYFALHTLAAVPFHGRTFFRPLLKALESVDRAVFRALPFTRRWAWQVIVVLEQPLRARG
jgi:ubiquinone/menaquinone biosynthesis C-methylase UbiE